MIFIPTPQESTWSSINTLLETGIELYKLVNENGYTKGQQANGVEVEMIADNEIWMMSNADSFILAIRKDVADQELSSMAHQYGYEKDGHLYFDSGAVAIPLSELSNTWLNTYIKHYIISEESLRATLCTNFPEYVKAYNATVTPNDHITSADAPLNLFLQKQLDLAADETRSQVAEYQIAHSRESTQDHVQSEQELELER